MYDDEPEVGRPERGCHWCHGPDWEPCSDECEDRYYDWETNRRRVEAMGDS